jgi:uncharacterized membrane protein
MTPDNTSRNAPDRVDFPFGGQPIHSILVPFSIACLAGVFVTDLVYWQTAAVMWESSSDRLITAGLIMVGFAIIAFVIDFVGGKQMPMWAGSEGTLSLPDLEQR